MFAICSNAEYKNENPISNHCSKIYKRQIYALIYQLLYNTHMEDEYNVNGYTDEQLFKILDLNNPSDRELEAKTLSMVRKYSNFGNPSGDKLSQFFIDIYNRFFENDEPVEQEQEQPDDVIEGFTQYPGNTSSRPYNKGPEISVGSGFKTYQVNGAINGNGNSRSYNSGIIGNGNSYSYNSGIIGNAMPTNVSVNNIFALSPDLQKSNNGVIGEANVGNKITPSENNVTLTKTLDYSKDKLNPLLKQTIKRIISIDSQYRNSETKSPSTNFTFNLSEPLRDVVSLSLYSIQIPYTWYTVNSDFGGNFFYLKGNAPGIMNGLHDYQISISSGNYTPSGLANALNKSINDIKMTITDVSFGQTQVIYNDGITDQNSGTGKCKLLIDITKIYNEGNYSLYFPDWTPPADNTLRSSTIAGYLGFNNQNYYCSSIYSSYLFPTGISSTDFTINTNKNSFQIVPYIGMNFLRADISYNPITISLQSLAETTTIKNAVYVMNLALQTNPKLDPAVSSCTLVDISNELQDNSGNSYIKLDCKLNNRNRDSPVVRNLKFAALFPYDYSGNVNISLFYGANSIFAFSDSVNYKNEYIVCEFNELLSETHILQSSYDSSNTSVVFQCNLPGYDNSYNSIIANLPPGTNALNLFIKSVNNSIKQAVGTDENFTIGSTSVPDTFYSDSTTNNLVFQPIIKNTFTNSDYQIYATTGTCKLPDIFNLPTTQSPATNIYKNENYQFNSVVFDALDIIYIIPNPDSNSKKNINANPFVISFEQGRTYSNGADLATYFTGVITSYFDTVTGFYPFVGSTVSYSINNGFTLELNIEINLNQTHYSLKLYSSNDIWRNLAFYDVSSSSQTDFSYNIKDYKDSSNNYKIESKEQIKDNGITIVDGSNDTFVLQPLNTVDVFNTSNNKYRITIKIPSDSVTGTRYSINELISAINLKFVGTIAEGTVFSTFDLPNGQTVIKCRFNINIVFTTKDYNLVFYDPYSFTSCFSNNSNKTTTSIQNVTWDTTLGWLLGYRNAISYKLSDYIGATDSYIYYLTGSSSNVCVLTGDTNVSTNLYNYFLIMLDDYVQNHLNDGLVTITNQETSVNHGPYVNVCDPVTGQMISRPADYGNPGISYTAQQLYAFNQQVQSQLVKAKSYSKGPFVKDVFGIIPVKTTGMSIGGVYVEFGGSMQNQQRLYFGPVNIHRMTIQLLNDRGNLVDLNNANWSFSFICEQLYKSGVS